MSFLLVKLTVGAIVFFVLNYAFTSTPYSFNELLFSAFCGYTLLVTGDALWKRYGEKTID